MSTAARSAESSFATHEQPVRAIPIAGLTFFCSLGTGVLWNAIYFIAQSSYGFTQTDSLLLAFVNGLLYTGVAMSAGRTVRFLERRTSPRSALGLVLLAQAIMAPLVLVFPHVVTLWICAVLMTSLGALQWPIVQHYLVSGRHGGEMRNAIGWWNVSWMAASALGLAAAGPLQTFDLMKWAIPALLPVNCIALCFLTRFPAHPMKHDADAHAHHVPRSYHALLACARVLHPIAYLVIGALAPILPYLFSTLGTNASWQAPIGATWHLTRLLAVLVLWRTAFWHGRGASLMVAGVLLSLGFAVAVAAPNEMWLIIGLTALGIGQGTIYYSAIYYGLAIGAAEVDAGGIHEALVGAGYFVGPMLGLIALSAGAGTPVFIGLVLGAVSIGFVVSIARGRAVARIN